MMIALASCLGKRYRFQLALMTISSLSLSLSLSVGDDAAAWACSHDDDNAAREQTNVNVWMFTYFRCLDKGDRERDLKRLKKFRCQLSFVHFASKPHNAFSFGGLLRSVHTSCRFSYGLPHWQDILGHSRPFFLYYVFFYEKVNRNYCSIKVAHDWIRTRVLWYRKRPSCQLCHNHCTMRYCQSLRKRSGPWSLRCVLRQVWMSLYHCRYQV